MPMEYILTSLKDILHEKKLRDKIDGHKRPKE
jgi:hypothetical protein